MGFTTLRYVTVDPPENLTCQFALADKQDGSNTCVLVIKFSGTYPAGSRGNAHGAYIATMGLLGISAFDPWSVVLDFTDLQYQWGNTLLKVLQDIPRFMNADSEPSDPPFPILVVTSEKSRAGFLSLVTRAGSPEPDWHFDEIQDAIRSAFEKADQWISV